MVMHHATGRSSSRHEKHNLWHRHIVPVGSTTLVAAFFLGYVLLEKKLLPKALWRPLSTFYFYPLMLPNLLYRSASGQAYFSDVDGGVMLGATPMVIAGHLIAGIAS